MSLVFSCPILIIYLYRELNIWHVFVAILISLNSVGLLFLLDSKIQSVAKMLISTTKVVSAVHLLLYLLFFFFCLIIHPLLTAHLAVCFHFITLAVAPTPADGDISHPHCIKLRWNLKSYTHSLH